MPTAEAAARRRAVVATGRAAARLLRPDRRLAARQDARQVRRADHRVPRVRAGHERPGPRSSRMYENRLAKLQAGE